MESSMALISIVIPCYNVQQWIDRCMESVTKQTIGIDNLEIILVNDASTDNTLLKLQEWEAKFPNNIIVVTYEENMRQGGARNIGLQYASADYIGFVDADDWIESDMYQELYDSIVREKCDLVVCKMSREFAPVSGNNAIHEGGGYRINCEKRGEWFYHKIIDDKSNGEFGSICTCLYSTELLEQANVSFPEHLAYEDNYWGSLVHLYVKNMYVLDKILYHYFINNNSTVTQRNTLHQLDRLQIEVLKVEEYKKRGAFKLFYKELEGEFVKLFYLNTMFIIFTRFDVIPDVFNYMKQILLHYFPTYKDNPIMQQCNAREKQLLRLLEIDRDLSISELEKIREVYLESFNNEK